MSLRYEAGVSITIYECGSISKAGQLGRVSERKEVVERRVSMCSSLSKVCEDEVLDREIQKANIAKCMIMKE